METEKNTCTITKVAGCVLKRRTVARGEAIEFQSIGMHSKVCLHPSEFFGISDMVLEADTPVDLTVKEEAKQFFIITAHYDIDIEDEEGTKSLSCPGNVYTLATGEVSPPNVA